MKRRLPFRSLTLAALLASALAACGKSEPPPAPSGPPIEACNLILQREAEIAAGMPLDTVAAPLDRSVGDHAAKCGFGAPIDGVYKLVSLEVRRHPSPEAAKEAFGHATKALRRLSGVEPMPLEGTGEEALWAGGRLSQLHVLSGRYQVIVTLDVGDQEKRPEAARVLAANALERLAGRAPAAGRPGSVTVIPSEE